MTDRSLAQYFFEQGFWSCFAEAMAANGGVPPFEITDKMMERCWQNSAIARDDYAEFDSNLALSNAAPDLLAALEPFARVGGYMCYTPHERTAYVGYTAVEADGINSRGSATLKVEDFRRAANAKAMCARQGQDAQRLGGDSPASAVGSADLPNTDRNPHQEDTTHDTD